MKCSKCGKRVVGRRSRGMAWRFSGIRLCGSCYDDFREGCYEGRSDTVFGLPRVGALALLGLMERGA